jgi:SAM-dependent methyltransferase
MASRAQLRDAAIEADVEDLLRHDDRLGDVKLDIAAHGGVVHLRGEVEDRAQRTLIRTLLCRLKPVHAVWDLVRCAGEGDPVVVDIGCGSTKQYGEAIGIDLASSSVADVRANLSRGLPLRTGSVDHLFAVHVLEHVLDSVALMNEIHRVLRPDGILHVLVPHWRHANAVADPTHVGFFGAETFRYFCLERPGILPFRPLAVDAIEDTVFADLEPAKDNRYASPQELARFFP